MKKIFLALILALIVTSAASAQTNFIRVPVLDPTNVTLFVPTVLSQFVGTNVFIMYLPSQATTFSIAFGPTLNSDSLTFIAQCTSDSNALYAPPPLSPANNWANVAAMSTSGTSGLVTFGSAASLTLATSGNFTTSVNIPVTGCAQLAITLKSATGTLTDTLQARGVISFGVQTTTSVGGLPAAQMIGVNFANTPVALRSDSSGDLAIATSLSVGTFNTNSQGTLNGVIDGASGNAKPLAVRPIYHVNMITGTSATVVGFSTSSRLLHTVTINTGVAATFSIFDLASASCTGTPATNQVAIITMTAAMAPVTLTYDMVFGSGICVQSSVTGENVSVTSD